MPSPAAAIAHKPYAQPRTYDSKSYAAPLSSGRPAHRWTEEADTRTPTEVVARLGVVASYARNAEIFGEDQPAENLYIVLSGAVRICKLLGDGRRQIETFCLPGDVFGWEMTGRHRFSAAAVSECKIVRVKRSILFSRASDDAELAHALWALTAAELGRAQNHLLVLGRKTAQERVATFLLDMAERAGAGQGPNGTEVTLPMSRQDIADFLGLTIETVSRTLTHLEEISAIALPSSRRVVLRDGATLRRLNS